MFGTRMCGQTLLFIVISNQWLKWGGLSPLLPFEPPAIVWAPIESIVLFYAFRRQISGVEMGMGFAPTWLRQVRLNHFNHCSPLNAGFEVVEHKSAQENIVTSEIYITILTKRRVSTRKTTTICRNNVLNKQTTTTFLLRTTPTLRALEMGRLLDFQLYLLVVVGLMVQFGCR